MRDFSGGLFYHLKAYRYLNHEWKDHRNAVARFLEAWNPKHRKLILIGPSGGYSLPKSFLEKFDSITVYEPDAVARFIFEKRFQLKPRWIQKPFDFESGVLDSDAAILFCNLLGQIPIRSFHRFRPLLLELLKGKEWASFHDAFSAHGIRFDLEKYGDLLSSKSPHSKLQLSEVKSGVHVQGVRTTLELTQHLSFDLFSGPEYKFYYWEWRLNRKTAHLIEGVFKVQKATEQKLFLNSDG